MANASAWAGFGGATEAEVRADAAKRRIDEKPSSIVIVRGTPKVSLPAQTMRIEYTNQQSSNEQPGSAGTSSVQQAIAFGICGHPSEPDTDIRRDDRFTFDGLQFRVVSVIRTLGEKQAKCEALA